MPRPISCRVQVILLDVRYFNDEEAFGSAFGLGGGSGQDILGIEQWAWFEREMASNESQLTLIGSGVQASDGFALCFCPS